MKGMHAHQNSMIKTVGGGVSRTGVQNISNQSTMNNEDKQS